MLISFAGTKIPGDGRHSKRHSRRHPTACLDALGALRDTYLTVALAASTSRSYRSGQKTYLKFCNQIGVSPFPLKEVLLEYFVTFLSRQVRADTIRCYLSGVQFHSTMLGYPERISSMFRLYYLIRGIKRSEGRSTRIERKPIRLKHLHHLKLFIAHRFTNFDRVMYTAVIAVAFFGMLRCSEYTAPGRWAWDPDTTLTRGDVAFKCGGGGHRQH